MLPSVSVCVPTWRRPELTRRAVESVRRQDYPGPLECVVYDDGSPVLFAHEWARVYVNPVNYGIAVAKNAALMCGTGELRGILDSDDELLPNHVSRCVAALQANPDVDVVYADDIDHDDATGAHVITPAADWNDGAALLNCALRGDTWLARWPALKRSGLHDERFVLEVDYDLFHALWESGARFQRLPGASVVIHRHSQSATKDRLKAAYWHAACLAKYWHSIDWALKRAASHPEWLPAIREGYAFGETLRAAH